MRREILLGSRGSDLALWQARWVMERLKRNHPGCSFRICQFKTKGDRIFAPLAKIEGKGLFTKDLEDALLAKKCDLAVHSMKDLPTSLPLGLTIGAVCRREQPGDVLISRRGLTLRELPLRARLGTSSLRRKAQLLRFRADLEVVDLRGNLTSRLRKMSAQDLDGIIVAYAGIYRLGLKKIITEQIPFSVCLPAAGQGAIGIEIREGDSAMEEMVAQLDDPETRAAVTAERTVLSKLEGGCQAPLGVLGRVENGLLELMCVVLSLDGRHSLQDSISGPLQKAASLGEELAGRMLKSGAGKVLARARKEFEDLCRKVECT